MYPQPRPEVERHRLTKGPLRSTAAFGNNGVFIIPGPARAKLCCIVSAEGGWDHVSISVMKQPNRCPTWAEMCFVKDLFWPEHEAVVQIHPAKSEYVSFHDWTLHLWRPQGAELPLPPHTMVGPKTVEEGMVLYNHVHRCCFSD